MMMHLAGHWLPGSRLEFCSVRVGGAAEWCCRGAGWDSSP